MKRSVKCADVGILRIKLATVAIKNQCWFKVQEPWHWQLGHNETVICDIWPTTMKVRRHAYPGRTFEYHIDQKIVDAVTTFVSEALKKTNKPQEQQELRPADPATAEPIQENVIFGPFKKRYVNVEPAMDDGELRLIINTSGYSESIRLDKEKTRLFLAKLDKMQ